MKIIGVSGKKNSGKDTISDIFVKREKFTKIAFADPLKELCSKLFRIEMKYFTDEQLKEQELPYKVALDYSHLDKLRDIIEIEWGFVITPDNREAIENKFYNMELKTPRQMLQTIGTDILRNHVRDDIWIVKMFEKIKDIDGDVVISDVRLKNEREALRKAKAKLILVKRSTVINATKDAHISENDLGKESDYDVVINNENISLNELRSEIEMWYSIAMKYRSY